MVELLAPAGSPEALDAAIACGADAVYLGLKSFNARMRSANFAYSQFEGALRSLHRMGRRVYVTVNTVFEQREADRVYQLLKYLAALGPDGIIVQDFGILVMAKEFPGLKIHASTQMNIASARGANALSKHGISRVVLARELSIEEIKAVKQSTNTELEVFVHGALCASLSGLCLFSSYLGGKSANRGMCTQACRRLYQTEAGQDGSAPKTGYYFSPCDLSLIGRIGELAEAGVRSFKIEGRMKSAEYVGTVVSAYRQVIDSLGGGENERRHALENARDILRNDFARPKTEYFFSGFPSGKTAETAPGAETADAIFRPGQNGGTGISLGIIVTVKGAGPDRRALVKTAGGASAGANFASGNFAGKLSPGDSVRLHRADDSRRLAHKLTFVEAAGRNGYHISIPEGFDPGDSVYLIQTKAMTRRYPPVIPRDLGAFRRQPGRERAPQLPLETAKQGRTKQGKPEIPEGIFAAVASIEDLYIVQSIRPAGVIVPVNRKTLRALMENNALPFKPCDIIPALDPYFPQEEEPFLAEAAEALEERGCRAFILNNPGHFSLFPKNKSRAKLIAGPWLYTFNSWAAAFTHALGAAAIVTPLENNRQNLEKTIPAPQRREIFVTLFAWPPLFRIKTGPGGLHSFKEFSGNGSSRNEIFSLLNGDGSSVVIPSEPFSIIDKRPFLEAASFRRFILDFSGGTFKGSFPLKKKLYKEVMKAVEEGQPLQGVSRFNWKDGFFQEKE